MMMVGAYWAVMVMVAFRVAVVVFSVAVAVTVVVASVPVVLSMVNQSASVVAVHWGAVVVILNETLLPDIFRGSVLAEDERV